jgi:2-polyprenyl-3-methyl-5-hydroxy-6-metoxy-1,4-benzoquinol methylase
VSSVEPIARFFDRETEPCCRHDPVAAGEPAGVSGISGVLVDAVERAGLQGRSVLDLGCGPGDLSFEVLRRGASRVTGVDLSSVSVEVARRRAAALGVSERASFEIGDAAAPDGRSADVVVLNRSLCCFPDADRFVRNTAPSAGSIYAISLPASRGIRGLLARVLFAGENAWRWLRRDPFRAFVHDVPRIDRAIQAAGLRPVDERRSWMWHVAVYTRG